MSTPLDHDQALIHQATQQFALRPEDIAYLSSRYPYLIVANPHRLTSLTPRRRVLLPSGWLMYDEGGQVAVTSGVLNFGPHNTEQVQQDDDGTSGIGTLGTQSIHTVWHIVQLLAQRWQGSIELIDGSQQCVRNLWIIAKALEAELSGYVPTKADKDVYARLEKNDLLQHHKYQHGRPNQTK